MTAVRRTLSALSQYPSAVAGLAIIAAMILFSIYTVIAIPYSEAIDMWRGGEGVWLENPRTALPQWVNLFPGVNLPETLILGPADETVGESVQKTRNVVSEEMTDVITTFTFDYTADEFPQEISLFLTSDYDQKRPLVSLTWLTPDGREIRITDVTVAGPVTVRFSQEENLQRRLNGARPEVGLFADPASDQDEPRPLKGTYQLVAAGLVFEDEANVDARLVVYGEVYGLAGTDHRRRDLMLALMWGMPVALAFGLLAAVGSTVSTLVVAAIGVWFGGFIDAAIQRITEVNLILPVLPILIMVGLFFSRSIWVMLGVLIMLSIFSSGIKTSRAIFLQIKESPLLRGRAGLRRRQFPHHFPLSHPPHHSHFGALVCGFHPCLRLCGSYAGRAQLGRPAAAHLGQSTQRRPRQRRALPGPLLLGARACRTLASLRPRLCHGRFRLG